MRSKRRQSGREMKGEWGRISDGMEGERERERGVPGDSAQWTNVKEDAM